MLYILSIHRPGHRAHPLSQTEYKTINWVSVSTFIVPSHLHSLPSLFLSSIPVLKITKSTTAKHACVLSRLQRNAGQVCHRLLLSCCSEKLWFHYDSVHMYCTMLLLNVAMHTSVTMLFGFIIHYHKYGSDYRKSRTLIIKK